MPKHATLFINNLPSSCSMRLVQPHPTMTRTGRLAEVCARTSCLVSSVPKLCSHRVLRYNVYTYEGSDDPWVADSGRMKNNVIRDNTINGSPESIKLGEADGTEFIDNTFEDPAKIRFEDCSGTIMSGNTGLDDVELTINDGACFDDTSDSAFIPVC